MSTAAPTASQIDLESYLPLFGLSRFRPGQKEVIAATLAGHDCLCIMPTGAGKSLCFQLPAVARDGLTLVVSPLIALMKDQVDQLQSRGLRATFVNSTLPPVEQYNRLDQMAAGQYDLVYVVPERFRSQRFVEAVKATHLQLLAIDEAHCVSQWGHDFRPDYARLGQFRKLIGNPPTIALTATATEHVRRDIIEMLDLREPKSIVTGFARPNLRYEVRAISTQREKDDALVRFLQDNAGSGIVYASTRKRCEEVAQTIASRTRRTTVVYHAGLAPAERLEAQEAFIEGRAEIIVATIAFGMGIDKADVRFVVHYNMTGSLEAYYQESGRAGRDSLPARCALLYTPSDRFVQEFFIESTYPSREIVAQLYDYLRSVDSEPIELTQEEIKDRLDLQISIEGVGVCEKLLEKAGVLERLDPCQNMAVVRITSDMPSLVDLLPVQAKMQRKVLQAIEKIVGERRHELVYFNRRDLVDQAGLDAAALSRALGQLRSLEDFQYVPPFRGRAIHMLERDKPLSKLQIDFEVLNRRKAADLWKLKWMIRYAENCCCRHQAILHYFGELLGEPCRNCDVCDSPAGPAAEVRPIGPADERLVDAVRKVLSGVARAKSKFGKNLLAQMLCGSMAENVTRFKLDRLSTHGILRNLVQSEVLALIDGLIAAGCLQQIEIQRDRPIVQFTELGNRVMQGMDRLEAGLILPVYLFEKIRRGAPVSRFRETDGTGDSSSLEEVAGDSEEQETDIDAELFESLKQWRRGVAETEKVAAFRVLSNATLEELARSRPLTEQALLATKGIGPAKLEKYGKSLLEILADRPGQAEFRVASDPSVPDAASGMEASEVPEPLDESNHEKEFTSQETMPHPARILSDENLSISTPSQAQSDSSDRQPSKTSQGVSSEPPDLTVPKPSHYWTWRLLSAGFSVADCAAIRDTDPLVVLDHALRAIDSGWPVEATWLLTPEKLSAMEKVIGSEQPAQIRPLLAQLPEGTRFEEIQLFLKCRQTHQAQ